MKTVRFALACLTLLAGCGRTDLEPIKHDASTETDGGPVMEGGTTCPSGMILCGATCVDPTDPNNCGGCGVKCGAMATCKMGICTPCPSGYSVCGTECVDLTGDSKNCGMCGMACTGMQVCASGLCSTACPIGRSKCGNDCVDVGKDPKNCGGCGVACQGGQSCVGGLCCATGESNCGGACVDTTSDPNNCGSCGTKCGMNEQCSGSTCGTCKKDVLVLSDNSTSANTALETAIKAAGYNPTFVNAGSYTGNPAATGFGSVVVTNGAQWYQDMPAAGQQAVVTAQGQNGVGVVTTEWFAYEIASGRYGSLKPLQLVTRQSGNYSTMTFTQSMNHPIWTGLPQTFNTAVQMGFNVSSQTVNGATVIATCSQCQNIGVAVKDGAGKTGRLVQIAHAGNFSTGGGAWTMDTNVTKMMTNAIGWAARCM